MRAIIPFNDNWTFMKPGEVPVGVTLPQTWNSVDGQDGGNNYWRGAAIYSKTFPRPEGDRVFLEFNGVAMTADITLNGVQIAHHEGGYSTFRVEITDLLLDKNELAVTVDNSENGRVYPQKADFTFYGGIYRDVNLIIVPENHFELLEDGAPGIRVTPVVSEDLQTATVTVETKHNGSGVDITVNGETKRVEYKAEFIIENVHLWDGLNDPYLYTATARLDSGDEVSARFGCRRFHIDPDKGFFLNGKSYPLRGVSRHQDWWKAGNAISIDHHREDMSIILELGANTLRLAHYQHAQAFYDLCDENGLIVWAEIPYITCHMDNGLDNTLSQMRELIAQSYNHPSIVCWGLSNEITAASPMNDALLNNHRALNDLAHQMDATRPTVMANVFMLETDSPILDIPDMNSYNLYFGWYLGELTQNDEFFDEYHAKYPEKIIGFSEYGADANPQYHSAKPDRGDYSEEYQCVYHEHILDLIDRRPYLWATHVWNLFDFAADGRDEGGKNGQNQKGLVTFDRKLRKDAFYLYQAAWSKEPFVHLCGSRYVDRTESETEIKVYSNLRSITLLVDGKTVETKAGRRVFTFTVPITGEHRIEATSGEYSDSMTIRKAAAPNPDYSMSGNQEIVNWFDKVDPDFYSVQDTLGILSGNPESKAILDKVMAKARASRGDVARSTSGNANLEKMMAAMKLETILKQVANVITPEDVREINAQLQKIKKG